MLGGSLMRVCPPLFRFAFVEPLFRFQFRSPAFEPLFQFPPTMASARSKPLSRCQRTPGGSLPPDPPKEPS